jgi:hypothetical protein
MPKFLIEVPHEPDVLSCARAIKVLLESGSHFLTHADFGCHDGVHKGWNRREATIVELCKFGLDELDDLIKHHEAEAT